MRRSSTTADIPQDTHISDIDVSVEMRDSFLEYAYSVIYTRALPDARDGLKPVQRRILFQMEQMGLRPDKGHVKSQRVVGEVMGKLHPHGDSAIYDALVRLAQPFNLRVPLLDGHGNFGSLDDGPAAARYTEVRLAPSAIDMTRDLHEDTVDYVPNYDNQFTQPDVLPAGFPQLLVNGASGIAVGMATKIPPHNLTETISAAVYLLTHPDATTEDLMRFIPGPDLPEGGIIVGLDGIKEAYETGRGVFKTRAKVDIEQVTPRKKGLVITQLPYLVGPEKVIEKIKESVSSGRLKGISAVQNLTDRHHGLRLVVEIKNGFNPDAVLQQLFQRTPLEDSFTVNTVALVDGQPQLLGLKALLEVFLKHRLSVTTRRCRYRINKWQEQLHLVEGLIIAVLNIDDVIAIIRAADDASTARTRLMTAFNLSELQAEHILELRLRRLTKYSQIELEAQRDELRDNIHELQEILQSDQLMKQLITKELHEVSARLGTPRRTLLIAGLSQALSPERNSGHSSPSVKHAEQGLAITLPSSSGKAKSLVLEIADDPCIVVLSTRHGLARISGKEALPRVTSRSASDGWKTQMCTTARAQIAVVTEDGIAHRIDVVDLPELPRVDTGISLTAATPAHLLIHSDSPAIGFIDPTSDAIYAMGTAQGVVKTLRPDVLQRDSWEVITLADNDRLVGFDSCPETADLAFITSHGSLLRLDAQKVRPQGRLASGMAGIHLPPDTRVLGFWVIPDPENSVTVTVAGALDALPGTGQTTVKVTPFSLYPLKGRNTQGVRAHRFLRGENHLDLAWVGPRPAHAATNDGSPLDLPPEDERRDGSGTPVLHSISSIG